MLAKVKINGLRVADLPRPDSVDLGKNESIVPFESKICPG